MFVGIIWNNEFNHLICYKSIQVTFTVDIRAMDDLGREAIIYEYSNRMYQICDKRSVLCVIDRKV